MELFAMLDDYLVGLAAAKVAVRTRVNLFEHVDMQDVQNDVSLVPLGNHAAVGAFVDLLA